MLRSPSASGGGRRGRLTPASRLVWTPALPRGGYGPAETVRHPVAEDQFGQNPGGQARRNTRPAQHQPARRRGHDPQRKPYPPEQVGVTFTPSAAWQRDRHGEPQPAQYPAPPRRHGISSSAIRHGRPLHPIQTSPPCLSFLTASVTDV